MTAGFTINMTDAETRKKVATLQAIHALTLELGTSMKVSNRFTALDLARGCGAIDPTKRTTKMPALKACIKQMKELDPAYEVKGTTLRVLNGK